MEVDVCFRLFDPECEPEYEPDLSYNYSGKPRFLQERSGPRKVRRIFEDFEVGFGVENSTKIDRKSGLNTTLNL